MAAENARRLGDRSREWLTISRYAPLDFLSQSLLPACTLTCIWQPVAAAKINRSKRRPTLKTFAVFSMVYPLIHFRQASGWPSDQWGGRAFKTRSIYHTRPQSGKDRPDLSGFVTEGLETGRFDPFEPQTF